jgi:hypothetical protein
MKKNKKNFPTKLKKLRLHHRVIFTLLGTTGIILVWRGAWTIFDTTPFLSHPLTSIIAGLSLVILSGIFFKLV